MVALRWDWLGACCNWRALLLLGLVSDSRLPPVSGAVVLPAVGQTEQDIVSTAVVLETSPAKQHQLRS